MSAEEDKKDVDMKPEEAEEKAETNKEESEEKAEAKTEDAEVKDEKEETEAKEEEGEEGAKEAAEKKEPEKPKEQEEDAADDPRTKVSPAAVDINVADATLNVMPTAGNKLLMPLAEGGFQHLLAGFRTTAGIKSGRYMFEVKILDLHNRSDQQASHSRIPMPRQLVRLGLSTAGSSLILADGGSDCVSIDSEGFFVFEKSRKKVSQKCGREATMALLVNMDEASPNANTISIFKDGVRVCQPQAIPEKLRGKTLFPTITYKNMTLQVNFGPNPLKELPFKCHMLASAATADLEVVEVPKPSDGKYEVVFPVGLPEQGYFDWVDAFLEKHPDYVELSDRKILDWAAKSGLWRPKAQGHSNDKPDMKFGIPHMDDLSVQRVLGHIAPTACRNFIVPELKANLMADERKDALSKFASHEFKKTAAVVVGEPTAEYKAKIQDLILAAKKAKAIQERKKKAAEEERKRLIEEKRKKADDARKAAKRKRDGEEEEAKEEEKEEEEEAKEETKDEEIVVELTDEEKALIYRKMPNPDITDSVLSKSYADFSLPSKEEGFDEVTFHWQSEGEATKVLKDWILSKKLTQRVEDLKPGEAFKEAWSKWQKSLQEWRKLASDWKDTNKRKALLAKRAEAKKKEAEEKGDEAPKEDPEIDVEDLDVFAVENVSDVGNGEPLFANFVYEDWFLLSTRYEIHLLLHSFKKDMNDSDRPSFMEKDLAFYYNKYFRKAFSLKSYNAKDLAGLVELIQDTLAVNKESSFLEPVLTEDTPSTNFVKLAEEHRRDRQRRLDAGDETAELKLPRNAPAPPARQPPSGSWQGGSSHRSGPPAVGSRNPPPARGPPSYSHGNGSGYSRSTYSGSSSAQKRAYTPTGASSYSSKQPRTSSYSGGGGGGGYGGGGSYYRR